MSRLLFVLVLVATGSLCAQNQAPPGLPIEVTRDDYSIKFPPDWEVGAGWTDEDVYALAPTDHRDDLFHENVNVLVDDEIGGLDLDEYYNLSVNGLRMLATDFKMEKSGETELGGIKAKHLTFLHRSGVYSFKVLQYLMIAGHKAYVITCTATAQEFEQYEPNFKQIAESFRLYHHDAVPRVGQ
jgi:hypothetical protein